MTTAQDVASRLSGQLGKPSGWSLGWRGSRVRVTTPAGDYELRSPLVPPQDTPLMILGKGLLAGAVGTAVITALMAGFRSLLGEEAEEGQPPAMYPQKETRRIEPAEELVQRVATGVAETEITGEQRRILGTALHWVYGSVWGAIYGLTQSTLHAPTALHGALLGLTVWGIGPLSLLPAIKLTPAPTEQPLSRTVVMGWMHLVYGWVTAYTFRLLSRDVDV